MLKNLRGEEMYVCWSWAGLTVRQEAGWRRRRRMCWSATSFSYDNDISVVVYDVLMYDDKGRAARPKGFQEAKYIVLHGGSYVSEDGSHCYGVHEYNASFATGV